MDGTQYQVNWRPEIGDYALRFAVFPTATSTDMLGDAVLSLDVVRTLNPNSNFPIKFWIGKTCTDCAEAFVGPDATEVTIPGEAIIVFTPRDGREFRLAIREYEGPDACLPIPHPQYHGCYEFDTDEPVSFKEGEATVYVCLEPKGQSLYDEGRLRLWKWEPEDHTSVTALEPGATVQIDCSGFKVPIETTSTFLGGALRYFSAAGQVLGPLFRVNLAYAQTRSVQGFGLRDLSRIGWVHELVIEKVSGDNQWAAPGAQVDQDPTVRVRSRHSKVGSDVMSPGLPVDGVSIRFTAQPSSTIPGEGSPAFVETTDGGLASIPWAVGSLKGATYTLGVEAFNPELDSPPNQAPVDLAAGLGSRWAPYGGTGPADSPLIKVLAQSINFTAYTPSYSVTWLTPLGTVSSSNNVTVSPLPQIRIVCAPAAGWPAGGYAGCPTLVGPVAAPLSGKSYQFSWSSPSDLPPGPHYRVQVLWGDEVLEVLNEVTIRAVAGGTKTKDPFTFEAGRTVPIKFSLQ